MIPYLLISLALLAQPADALRFRALPMQEHEIIAKLPSEVAAKLPIGRLTQSQGEAVLTVGLIDEETKKAGPAMLGKYERIENQLTFTPRFPLTAKESYRASLKSPAPKGEMQVALDYRVPPPPPKTPPTVVKIYPTADVLPANQLKVYIYFDRPMRGGKEIFKQIVLVDDKGKVIADPWLLDEIWDEENHCLILYIHPGRIKWGVFLRELLGPVLFEKRQYSLVIRGELTDIEGNKIGKDVVKTFRTTPEDRARIDLSAWKLTAPKATTREPLTATLPRSIDHRGLRNFLTVTDDKGQRIEGALDIGKDEKTWTFTPKANWHASTYHLAIDGQLEDVAGNNPLRAFDFDLKAPKLATQKLRFDFEAR